MLRRGLLALAALLLLAGAAQADTLVVATCGTLPLAYTPGDVRPDTEDVNGNKCITGNISASAVTAATAAAALPTIAPGAGPVYQSLGGAQYVQPVFDSENGGGTIVGLLNGLPVQGTVTATQGAPPWSVSCTNCSGGGGASTVTTTQGTVPWLVSGTVTTTPSGTQSVSSTGQANVGIVGVPAVSTTGQIVVNIGATPSVSSTGQTNVGIIGVPAVSSTGQQTVYVGGTTAASDALGNPTTSNILAYLLGWDPTNSVWRRAQVQGGAQWVAVSGTASISATGQQNVGIVGVPAVSSTGNINVGQAGAPWTISSTGQANVGIVGVPSVSSTGVATVALQGTPSVSSTGQLTVNIGATPSVSSTGTANVGIVGVPSISSTGDMWVTGTFRLQDATSTPVANVKAASTNVTSTDQALVVAPSPNPSTVCPSVLALSQTASTNLITSTNRLHICSILIVSAAVQSLSLVEGVGTTCGTNTAALIGGTSASLSAQTSTGFAMTAERPFLETKTTGDALCLLQSGSGNISGMITYIDHN